MYENFSLSVIDGDIAVIKLPTPLTFNDYVQPVCLPSTPVAAGTKCYATGWGDTQGKQCKTYLCAQFFFDKV